VYVCCTYYSPSSSGTDGVLLSEMIACMPGVAVVMDYQNIHLTAHGRFCAPGEPVHECLTHPLYFANQILLARRSRKVLRGLPADGAPLTSVSVFRGLPSNLHQPDFYRRNLAQRSEWTRDPRVKVSYRALRYSFDDAGQWTAREKGVDVQVALEIIRHAQSGDYDAVILATHDTDLEPALDYCSELEPVQTGRVVIETAGWHQCKRLRSSGTGALWHTTLDRSAFDSSIDRKPYP
jgi:hypothetical protein